MMMFGTNGATATMGSWGLLMMVVMLAGTVLAVLGGIWLYRHLVSPRD